MYNLLGQCYDRASNMSAVYKGTQAPIQKEQPLAYYTHCSSHRLNLVCKSVAQCKDVHDSISIVNNIGVLFRKSGKFRDLFQSIDNDKTRFKSMCPTRWTVRCKDISAVLHTYLDIINALEKLTMACGNSTELIAKAYSYKNTLLETSTYFIKYSI